MVCPWMGFRKTGKEDPLEGDQKRRPKEGMKEGLRVGLSGLKETLSYILLVISLSRTFSRTFSGLKEGLSFAPGWREIACVLLKSGLYSVLCHYDGNTRGYV